MKMGEHIHSVTTEQISLFYAEGRTVFLLTGKGRKFIIEHTLEELESLVDPEKFFRSNRSFIVHINAIHDVVAYSSSRLKIRVNTDFDKEILVSREKVPAFKKWLSGDRS